MGGRKEGQTGCTSSYDHVMTTSPQAAPEPNFQTRLVAPAARGEHGNVTGAEIGDVVARLLLFET